MRIVDITNKTADVINKAKYGISGLILALSISCGGPATSETFPGTFNDPTKDSTYAVEFLVFKNKQDKPLTIQVWTKDYRLATFSGAAAESLYYKLVPDILKDYNPRDRVEK